MFYISLVLIPPILYTLSSLLDKILVHGDEEDSRASVLSAIGGFFNFLIAIPIFLFLIWKGNFIFSLPLFLNGTLFALAIFIYLSLLKNNDVDRIVPWYQTIPIFGLIGGILYLGEIPTTFEFLGVLTIIAGGLIIAIKKGKIDFKIISLMLISSLLIAINDVVFAYYGRSLSISNALFSDIAGKGILGLLFLILPGTFRGFKKALKTKFGLQSINEIVFTTADAIFDVAKLFVPVVVVQAFASTQPVFVFLGAYLLKKYNPHLIDYEIGVNNKIKFIGIFLFVIGGILLSLSLI